MPKLFTGNHIAPMRLSKENPTCSPIQSIQVFISNRTYQQSALVGLPTEVGPLK